MNPIGTAKADHLASSSLGCGFFGGYSDMRGSGHGSGYLVGYSAFIDHDADGETGYGSGFGMYEDEDCNGFGYGSETGTELDDASGFGAGYETTSPNRRRRAE